MAELLGAVLVNASERPVNRVGRRIVAADDGPAQVRQGYCGPSWCPTMLPVRQTTRCLTGDIHGDTAGEAWGVSPASEEPSLRQ